MNATCVGESKCTVHRITGYNFQCILQTYENNFLVFLYFAGKKTLSKETLPCSQTSDLFGQDLQGCSWP